jgi:hypothetical protein
MWKVLHGFCDPHKRVLASGVLDSNVSGTCQSNPYHGNIISQLYSHCVNFSMPWVPVLRRMLQKWCGLLTPPKVALSALVSYWVQIALLYFIFTVLNFIQKGPQWVWKMVYRIVLSTKIGSPNMGGVGDWGWGAINMENHRVLKHQFLCSRWSVWSLASLLVFGLIVGHQSCTSLLSNGLFSGWQWNNGVQKSQIGTPSCRACLFWHWSYIIFCQTSFILTSLSHQSPNMAKGLWRSSPHSVS